LEPHHESVDSTLTFTLALFKPAPPYCLIDSNNTVLAIITRAFTHTWTHAYMTETYILLGPPLIMFTFPSIPSDSLKGNEKCEEL